MTISRTAAAILGVVAISAIGLAGCGSSDSATSSSAVATATSSSAVATAATDGDHGDPRMTAESYRAAADTICEVVDTKAKAIANPSSPTDFGAYLTEVAAVAQNGVDGLSGLYPPTDFEAAHLRMIKGQQIIATLTKSLAGEAGASPTAAEGEALMAKMQSSSFMDATTDVEAAAKEMGLTGCADND